MDKSIVLLTTLLLTACTSAGRERACEVFSPAEIDLPTTHSGRVIGPNSGEGVVTPAEQRCQ